MSGLSEAWPVVCDMPGCRNRMKWLSFLSSMLHSEKWLLTRRLFWLFWLTQCLLFYSILSGLTNEESNEACVSNVAVAVCVNVCLCNVSMCVMTNECLQVRKALKEEEEDLYSPLSVIDCSVPLQWKYSLLWLLSDVPSHWWLFSDGGCSVDPSLPVGSVRVFLIVWPSAWKLKAHMAWRNVKAMKAHRQSLLRWHVA